MSWIYKHQTEAFALFTGAAFAMCLGALMHTAIRGFPFPKAAYFACTITYILVASLYVFFWYHSRQHARSANKSSFLNRRPSPPRPAESPQALQGVVLDAQQRASASGTPTAASREHGQLAQQRAPGNHQYMPRPAEPVPAHPPAARFSPQAPPASSVQPAPRMPPVTIPRKPVVSARTRASAPPANPPRLGGVTESVVPQAAEHAVPQATEHAVPQVAEHAIRQAAEQSSKTQAKTRHSTLSLSKFTEPKPTKSVSENAEDSEPAKAGSRDGAPVERPGPGPSHRAGNP